MAIRGCISRHRCWKAFSPKVSRFEKNKWPPCTQWIFLPPTLQHQRDSCINSLHLQNLLKPSIIYSGTSLLRTLGTSILVLITEVSSIQRSFNTLLYYTGTQNGVLFKEVSTFQRFVANREVPLYYSVIILMIS